MHMADALLSPVVAAGMSVVSAGAIGLSAYRLKKDGMEDNTIPMMGVMGAFVFAAQMINFTIPLTGSSGHLGGGVLLAALLGPWAGLLTLSAVLIIQCLFFADGGLLALGCNVFNMGFLTCVCAYFLAYKPILRGGASKRRIMLASVAASVLGLQLGAFGVVIQTALSGVAELPLLTFMSLMQPIHLAIGAVEGLVTGAVLCFVASARPKLIARGASEGRTPFRTVALVLSVVALLTAGGLSLYASQNPDGLEWAILQTAGTEEVGHADAAHERAEEVVQKTAVFPDYEGQGAGIVGSLMTVALALGAGLVIRVRRRQRRA